MGVSFFYATTEIVVISLFCLVAWKCGMTRAPTNASLYQVLFLSYEEAAVVAKENIDSSTRTLGRSDVDTAVETEIPYYDTPETHKCIESKFSCGK